jgi:hypothetical protein
MDCAVKILLTEVKYEVKFDTWLKEKILNAEEKNRNKERKVVDYAYKNDKAEDWLVRKIQDAVDNVNGELRWCIVEPARLQSDEILDNPDEWTIHLRFSPLWFGSLRALKMDIHRYVCEYVLSQWYRIVQPQMGLAYLESANEYLTKAYNEARSEKVVVEPWRM